ncbi:MAG TPA: hypothetical protein VG651_05930 [Stellaceae bacterium]|nr:hypothetical protein [Stellaceae bacterium]
MEALEALLPLLFGFIAIWFSIQVFLWLFPYILLVLAAALACWLLFVLIREREGIARWYYFTFHPHPAEPLIRSALSQGTRLDGDRLAAILGDLPPDNRVLRDVRIAQGDQLVAQMRQVSERTIEETLRDARADNARAAAVDIQAAIALAAVALERAKAAHAASKAP